ncbi:MAG: YybH family protein [Vicinamibacterales bacterium]
MRGVASFLTITLALPSIAAAHQHVADGTVTDWVEPARARRPGPPTLTDTPSSAQAASGDVAAIEAWLKGYDAAFLSKDLDRIGTFYHPDVTIFEGAGVNNGWVDYRDRHLGPELKAFANLEFGHTNYTVRMLGDRAAYVTSEYFIKAKMNERNLDSIGRETLIVEKQGDGTWKIRHSHTGSRQRPAPKPAIAAAPTTANEKKQ